MGRNQAAVCKRATRGRVMVRNSLPHKGRKRGLVGVPLALFDTRRYIKPAVLQQKPSLSHTPAAEKINTHFISYHTFFFFINPCYIKAVIHPLYFLMSLSIRTALWIILAAKQFTGLCECPRSYGIASIVTVELIIYLQTPFCGSWGHCKENKYCTIIVASHTYLKLKNK